MNVRDILIKLDDLGYSYDGNSLALDSISLTIESSSKYVLIGANGSGKSTLAHVIAGSLTPTSGQIFRNPNLVGPNGSMKISVVQQNLSIYEHLTVAQNFAVVDSTMGSRLRRSNRRINSEVTKWLALVGAEINPRTIAGTLTFADRQLIEIARALYQGYQLIILDEPTAALDPESRERLLEKLNGISIDGVSVLLITHDFEEVSRFGGEVIELQEGKKVDYQSKTSNPYHELLEGKQLGENWAMLGFRMSSDGIEKRIPLIKGVATIALFDNAIIRSGIWLSFAGIEEGSSYGTWIAIEKLLVQPLSSSTLFRRAIRLIPSDRQRYGIFASLSVADNVRMFLQDLGLISLPMSNDEVEQILGKLGVVMPGSGSPMATLSGGNQQKALFAGALEGRPRCLILEEPVLGMDDFSTSKSLKLLEEYLSAGGSCLILTCFARNYERLSSSRKLIREFYE